MEFNPLPIIIAAVGSYFLIKLRFFFILHPVVAVSRGLRAIKDKRARRSFSLALAGTLGVGNVFGVALGVLIGGAGSLFWLFVSMIFAMVIKYAEVVITADNLYHDRDTHGGIYYVIRASFLRGAGALSYIYSASIFGLSLFMGAALQSDAVVESALAITDVPRIPIGIFVLLITLVAIIGGTRKIEKITSIIIPITTIVYIFITLSVVISHIDGLNRVLSLILESAFCPKSAVGGTVGFLTLAPIREGFARGLLSNEAGAGTSSVAHARSGVLSPSSAGLLGVFEVWFDTGLICMLTGLSILLAVPDISIFESGMQLVSYSVGSLFGTVGKVAVTLCVFAFAYATVICWYYYGSEACGFLFGKRKRAAFLPLFLTFVFVGCFADTMILVSVTDALMLISTVITLLVLIKNSDRIRYLSEIGGVICSDRIRVKRLRAKSIKGNGFSTGERRR